MEGDNLRPLGDILLDIEPSLFEMCKDHDLQHGDILYLIKGWLDIHYPGGKEEFVDGDDIFFYYGGKRVLLNKLGGKDVNKRKKSNIRKPQRKV